MLIFPTYEGSSAQLPSKQVELCDETDDSGSIAELGIAEGYCVGDRLGALDGAADGENVGACEGAEVGALDGWAVGSALG